LGLPSAVENDARLALIGEWQQGAARGAERVAIVTLGTGVGTSVILDGKPMRGPHGSAGNLGGHTAAVADGRRCFCGLDGCYESETGSAKLPDVVRDTAGYADSPLANEPVLDYAAVFAHAETGDPCAVAVRDRSIRLWARLCLDLSRAYELDRVVVGGGVMQRADAVVPALQTRLDEHRLNPIARTRVVASSLGEQMAISGVPWLVEERLERA